MFCPTWADEGKCGESPEFMHRHCGLSCRVCNGGTPYLERMPLVGWGTCCRPSARGEALKTSMREFLRMGGRLIDTAIMYGNHREIGAVLREPEFQPIKREDIFITSKVPPTDFGQRETKGAMTRILNELNVDYIDLVLLHAPGDPVRTYSAWAVLQDEFANGRARAIGVSNFEPEHFEQLIQNGAKVTPMNNQISLHPGQTQNHTLRYCKEHGISITAFNSIKGRGSVPKATLSTVAASHNKTEVQVLLRWGVDHGVSVIPGCTSPGHLREALEVMEFGRLSDSELAALGSTVVMHSAVD